jgi:hypothetical protein
MARILFCFYFYTARISLHFYSFSYFICILVQLRFCFYFDTAHISFYIDMARILRVFDYIVIRLVFYIYIYT